MSKTKTWWFLLLAGVTMTISIYLVSRDDSDPKAISRDDSNSAPLDRSIRPQNASNETVPSKGPTNNARGAISSENNDRKNLTPLQARELIEKFNAGNTNVFDRASFSSEIIGDLCKAGHTDEAWKLIDDGRGTTRNVNLTAFFQAAEMEPDALFQRLSDPDLRSDLSSCLKGLVGRFQIEQLEGVLTSQGMAGFTAALGEDSKYLNLSPAVSIKLQRELLSDAADPSTIADVALRLNSLGMLNAADLYLIATSPKVGSEFDKWELVKGVLPAGELAPQVRGQRNKLISEMITTDAPKAMSQIFESENGIVLDDLQAAIRQWSNIDASGAATWYESNAGRLNEGERDAIATSFASTAASSLEFESAKLWIGQISDPRLQAQATELLEKELLNHNEFQTKQ